MLRNLQIRNFAIIDQIDVEFDPGMTVLTGETGAGKSILVDALGLVLGDRGGNGLVRSGAKRAEFSAEFSLADLPAAKSWLDEQALDQDDECVLRRVINADGRSRAFINGSPVSLQTLKTLGDQLLDIHGQHFHQSLGRRDVQRDLLDHFADIGGLRMTTGRCFETWRSLETELEQLEALDADRESRIDLLEFQLGELDALDAQSHETETLEAERQVLKNAGFIAEGVSGILQSIYDDDAVNAQSLIAEAVQTLETLSGIDAQLEPILSTLQEAGIQIAEAADALRRYADRIDMDPIRRDWVEERLDAIRTIARKHRVEPEALGEVHARIRKTLAELQDADRRSVELADKARDARDAYYSAASTLSEARKTAAAKFSHAVTETMQGLGMPGGVFKVSVTRTGEGNEKAHGIDVIEFQISANPGQPPMPLAKVASGGELSRMSLAIQVIASDGNAVPTMIFDEVDSGIGGGVAEMLGRRLKQVGDHCQVLSVTHLPQVASVANHHFRINKVSDGKTTRTGVAKLGDDERIEELARMLGGVEITKKTREYAAEMLRSGLRPGDDVQETA
jgi:DNA repair protein RecN (Recombination protein N)